jgi:predicted permease
MTTYLTARFARIVTETVRRLVHAPVFALSGVVCLGLTFSIVGAALGILNSVLVKRVSVPDSGALFRITYQDSGTNPVVLPAPLIRRVLEQPPRGVAQLTGHAFGVGVATIAGSPTRARLEAVTGSYFRLVGAVPLLGRLITDNDDSGSGDVCVLSRRAFHQWFNDRTDAVGSVVTIAGRNVLIVGVVSNFNGLGSNVVGTDAWVSQGVLALQYLYGRLDQASIPQINAQLGAFDTDVRGKPRRLEARPGLFPSVGFTEYAAGIAAVCVCALVALVAVSCLSLQFVARALARRGEIAVRRALGAERRDILLLFAAEVTLVVFAALLFSLVVSKFVTAAIVGAVAARSGLFGVAIDPTPDIRVVAALTGLALAMGWTIVVAMTVQADSVEAIHAITRESLGTTGSDAAGPFRKKVIAAQVACCTFLLLTAGFLLHGTMASLSGHTNYDVSRLAVGWINEKEQGQNSVAALVVRRQLLDDLLRTPGIAGAAITTALPGSSGVVYALESSGGQHTYALARGITADYFFTTGWRIERGRSFTMDEVRARNSVVISQSLARTGIRIGETIKVDGLQGASSFQVIGVASDERLSDARQLHLLYVPIEVFPAQRVAFMVRSAGSASEGRDVLIRRVRDEHRDLLIQDAMTLSDYISGRASGLDLVAWGLGWLGGLAAFVALVGVYGVTAYLAERRRRELNIRKALGAPPLSLAHMICSEALWVFWAGALPGSLLAMIVAFAERGRVVGVNPFDPAVLVVVIVLLLMCTVLASVLPFRALIFSDVQMNLRDS